jgi:RimJ/RimL family protein N-acetyltransferase
MLKGRLKAILGPKGLGWLQRTFWVRVNYDYFIENGHDFSLTEARVPCLFIPIDQQNCHRVVDFQERERVTQYQEKLTRHEVGYFAKLSDGMAGSIWATVNGSNVPMLVRGYIWLNPREALIHDIVTGERSRGQGVGPFMTSRMAQALFSLHGVARIVIDVATGNDPSNRMMEKIGLQRAEKVLYLTFWHGRAYHFTLHNYYKREV